MWHSIVIFSDWMESTFPDWFNSVFFTGCFSMVLVPYLAWLPKGSLSDEPFD